MLLIFFLISFNYAILKGTKDAVIVPSCGADALPFLKVYGTVPAAILFVIIYSKLSNILSKPTLFYVTILPFILFFALFATVLYPNPHFFHPVESALWLNEHLPIKLMAIASIYERWTYAIFYILSELWGSVVLSLLFWGFANDITGVKEAKRFYALFGLGANLALIVAGELVKTFARLGDHLPEKEAWGLSLNYLMGAVVIGGSLVIVVYWWMQRYVLRDEQIIAAAKAKMKPPKPKMPLAESFTYLARSPYMALIATIVACWGMAINFIEVSWKGQVRVAFPSHTDYSWFMGTYSQMTGIVTCLMILFVSGNVIRRFGWTTAALLTPIVVGLSGIAFFGTLFFKEELSGFGLLFGTSPLIMVVVFGLIQNVVSSSCKYSLFDPTKEMTYIPLDEEQKVKGKAAIDVVGARLGKSGGSFVQQLLIATVGFGAMMPYVAVMVGVTIALWILATKALGRRFTQLESSPIVKESGPEAPPLSIIENIKAAT